MYTTVALWVGRGVCLEKVSPFQRHLYKGLHSIYSRYVHMYVCTRYVNNTKLVCFKFQP